MMPSYILTTKPYRHNPRYCFSSFWTERHPQADDSADVRGFDREHGKEENLAGEEVAERGETKRAPPSPR